VTVTLTTVNGLGPTRSNLSNIGRPIRIADRGAKPIKEALA
jgi:hypothetical protein